MSVHRFFAVVLGEHLSDGRNGIGSGRFLHIPPGVLGTRKDESTASRLSVPEHRITDENGLTFRLQPAGFDVCTFLKSPRNPLSGIP